MFAVQTLKQSKKGEYETIYKIAVSIDCRIRKFDVMIEE